MDFQPGVPAHLVEEDGTLGVCEGDLDSREHGLADPVAHFLAGRCVKQSSLGAFGPDLESEMPVGDRPGDGFVLEMQIGGGGTGVGSLLVKDPVMAQTDDEPGKRREHPGDDGN